MSIPGAASPLFIGAAAEAGAFQIDKSVRLNSADSVYFSRTPSAVGNRKTWTLSFWVKKHRNGGNPQQIFGQYRADTPEAQNRFQLYFDGSTDKLEIHTFSLTHLKTDRIFRDNSAWYHIVLAVDTTLATADNRMRLYVNGAEETSFTTRNNPSQNLDLGINTDGEINIGTAPNAKSSYYADVNLAEINFVEGSQLAASDFGEYDDNNVWQPKDCQSSLTYGTNGYYLKFADNSSASNLGTDSSGNSNTWTVNNLSVASGAGNDSLIDTPTNYTADSGNNGGNYATLNPLSTTNAGGLANGNLEHSGLTNSHATIRIPSTGKWYFEFTPTQKTAGYVMGIQALATPASPSNSNTMGVDEGGNRYNGNGSTTSSFLSAIGVGDTLGVAIDQDGDTINFYRNGVAGGSTLTPSSLGSDVVPFIHTNSATVHVNFGQRPFAYTPPTGYVSLCTQNLTDPTIADGSTAMDAVLYTGDGNSTQTITGLSFAPDLTWQKIRNTAGAHGLTDSVRGVSAGYLSSDSTNAETGNATNGVSAFTSDGFTTAGAFNTSSNNWVTWAWDAGTSTATNNDGSIASSVRVNQSAGISIATWTGQSSGSATIGHGLNAAPEFIILKGRTGSVGWTVGHQSIGWTKRLQLNTTAVQSTSSNYWNDTAPTSSVFTSGANNVSNTFVAYCFAPVSQYSSFGSYIGNGSSTNAPFVYTGFRPAFLLIKNSSLAGSNWIIIDTARDTFNEADNLLKPNSANAEQITTANEVDILSNGFKPRGTDGDTNGNGNTLVYAAFGDPFKTARAR